MKAITKNLQDIDFKELKTFVTKGRFEAGMESLVNWYRVGRVWNEVTVNTAVKRPERVSVFEGLIGKGVSKDDRSACGRLATYPLEHVKTWYQDTKRFAVSPRTIVKKYGNFVREAAKADQTPLEATISAVKESGRKAIRKDVKALELIAALEKAIAGVEDMKKLKAIDNLLQGVTDELNIKINGLTKAA